MSKPLTLALVLATSFLASAFAAKALESLSLPSDLPPLDRRGGWRETLEDLAALGVPQDWTILGPIANETAKSFDKQLEPDTNDDYRGGPRNVPSEVLQYMRP